VSLALTTLERDEAAPGEEIHGIIEVSSKPVAPARQNNLNLLRLFAAGLVVFGHAFVFIGKTGPNLLGFHLGALGVYIFFCVSGFLVAQSWDRDPNFKRFLARRALRIFPALVVCVLATVLILGPLFSSLGWKAYFRSPDTWGYLRNIGLYCVYSLPGVFTENCYKNAVNGSLWTLPVEFAMYLILALSSLIVRNRLFCAFLAVVWGVVAFLWAMKSGSMYVVYGTDIRQLFTCGVYFWIGASINRAGLQKFLNMKVAACALLLHFLVAPYPSISLVCDWFIIPILALSFGLRPPISAVSKLLQNRDYSYGIYIYAFPVQQSIACLYPHINIAPYLVLSAVLIVLCAALSWHLVERPFLSLKPFGPSGN